jgi:hypothetical protein
MAMQMLRRPDKLVMLFTEDHEVRWVRMNQPHPAKVIPSWHGMPSADTKETCW